MEFIARGGKGLHLLITDVILPGMDGRKVAREVAVLCPGIPVLYVSGYTGDAIVHHGIIEEGLEFLSKPFTAGELLTRVRTLLDASSGPLSAA